MLAEAVRQRVDYPIASMRNPLRYLSRLPRETGDRLRHRLEARSYAERWAQASGRDRSDVREEAARLQRERGLSLMDIDRYGLFRGDLSYEEKASYLPSNFAAQRQLFDRFVPAHRRALYHNKLLFYKFFSGQGFPLARVIGVLDVEYGHREDGAPFRTADDLAAWMRDASEAGPPAEGFVVKPVEGLQGHAIHVLERRAEGDPERFLALDGTRFSAAELYAATAGNPDVRRLARQMTTRSFLVEERLRPHSALLDLIGPTLCTVRVVTFVGLGGEAELLAAVLKIQPGRSGVDHLFRGATAAWVDPDTGTLGPARSKNHPGALEVVPGTDRRFVGFEVPFWSDVLGVALRAQAAFPWARSIGWDVAVTDRGPALIEGNEWWGFPTVQLPAPYGLRRGAFAALCEAAEAGRL